MSQVQVNPSALSPTDLARVLAQAGAEGVTTDAIAADVVAGCPLNPDGTINLIHYTAWLVSRSDG